MRLLARLRRGRGPLSCRQVGRVLQTYLDGELDETNTARVAAHLDDCRRCGLEADVHQALVGALREGVVPIEEAPLERLRAFGEHLARIGPDEDDGHHQS